MVDVAPQTGVRQTRLLEGEYIMTKEDLQQRTRFADSIARGRDYYMPYRVLLPQKIDNLLVAGRHYSVTSQAQKISREIPPCMAMGEAAGVAAALALNARRAGAQCRRRRGAEDAARPGRDPGDQSGRNADVPALAARTGHQRRPSWRPYEHARTPMPPHDLPLAGIRVVDFTQVMMGPVCTQMLGDYGADVLKIERKGAGDLSRSTFEPVHGADNPIFCSLNRNKRSAALDLRDPAAAGGGQGADRRCRRGRQQLPRRRHGAHGPGLRGLPGASTRASSMRWAPATATAAPTPTRAGRTCWRRP